MSLSGSLLIEAPGAYELIVSVESTPIGDVSPRLNGTIQRSRWVYVRDDGSGSIQDAFDASRLREGTVPVPGPERDLPTRDSEAGATGPAEAGPALAPGQKMYVHLYFNEGGQSIPIEGALVEIQEYDSFGGPILEEQFAVTDANGIATFICTEYWNDIYPHLWGVNASHLTSYSYGGVCSNPIPTFSFNKGDWGRVFVNLNNDIIPTADGAFSDSRGVVKFVLGSANSNYNSFEDRILVSYDHVYGSTGLFVQSHEYGHAFHEKGLGGNEGSGQCPSPHYFTGEYNYQCAFSEGFATYVAGAVGYWNPSDAASIFASGNNLKIEGAVAYFLKDVTDATNSESYDNVTISHAYIADIIETCQVQYSFWFRPDRVHWLTHCIQRQIDGYNGGGFPPSEEPSNYSVSSGHSVSATDIRRLWRWHFFSSEEMYPPPPGSDPLEVEIVGPDWVPEHAWEACSWSASTSGGSGTPTYEWKWDLQFVDPPTGPGPDWWGDTGTDGYKWIEVTVTDASGSAYDAMQVHVDDNTEWGNCF